MGELRRLCYQTKEKGSFKTFKWVLKGRWNQGTGNSGSTRTYLQWDELGISYVGSGGVKYGPTYWTVDSYSSSGSLWGSRPASEMFDGEWGSETSKSDYKDINDTDGYVEIIIHTTSGHAIIPNGIGLISCSNQSSYASSTPAHFILYGLDESTNEYIQLIDVPAANVNKGNTQTTTVTFDPVEVVTGNHYLLAPTNLAKGRGLRYELIETTYKRYMFRWDNVLSGSVFQLSRIQIDDVELPYTFVGYGISGGNYQSNEPANAMIASTSSFSDPNNKWCMTNVYGQYAWFIFDLQQSHHPVSYRLMSGNDTSFQQGRNPQRVRLYGTNKEATDFDDPSWVLLSDEYNYNNSLLATGNREWSNYIQLSV